jgi:hypothetical protein
MRYTYSLHSYGLTSRKLIIDKYYWFRSDLSVKYMEQNIGIRLEPGLVLYLICAVAAIKEFEGFLLIE